VNSRERQAGLLTLHATKAADNQMDDFFLKPHGRKVAYAEIGHIQRWRTSEE
jgi:hypothetical protein